MVIINQSITPTVYLIICRLVSTFNENEVSSNHCIPYVHPKGCWFIKQSNTYVTITPKIKALQGITHLTHTRFGTSSCITVLSFSNIYNRPLFL